MTLLHFSCGWLAGSIWCSCVLPFVCPILFFFCFLLFFFLFCYECLLCVCLSVYDCLSVSLLLWNAYVFVVVFLLRSYSLRIYSLVNLECRLVSIRLFKRIYTIYTWAHFHSNWHHEDVFLNKCGVCLVFFFFLFFFFCFFFVFFFFFSFNLQLQLALCFIHNIIFILFNNNLNINFYYFLPLSLASSPSITISCFFFFLCYNVVLWYFIKFCRIVSLEYYCLG